MDDEAALAPPGAGLALITPCIVQAKVMQSLVTAQVYRHHQNATCRLDYLLFDRPPPVPLPKPITFFGSCRFAPCFRGNVSALDLGGEARSVDGRAGSSLGAQRDGPPALPPVCRKGPAVRTLRTKRRERARTGRLGLTTSHILLKNLFFLGSSARSPRISNRDTPGLNVVFSPAGFWTAFGALLPAPPRPPPVHNGSAGGSARRTILCASNRRSARSCRI